MSRFNGEVAIVTGGASGIGAATCRQLVADGARVVVADLNGERAAALADELGDAAAPIQFDAGDVRSVERMVAETEERHGRLDILHNNAAAVGPDVISRDRDALNTDFETWDLVMAVNL